MRKIAGGSADVSQRIHCVALTIISVETSIRSQILPAQSKDDCFVIVRHSLRSDGARYSQGFDELLVLVFVFCLSLWSLFCLFFFVLCGDRPLFFQSRLLRHRKVIERQSRQWFILIERTM